MGGFTDAGARRVDAGAVSRFRTPLLLVPLALACAEAAPPADANQAPELPPAPAADAWERLKAYLQRTLG